MGPLNSLLNNNLPLSNLCCLWLMQMGEVVFGGLGSGLNNMLMVVLMTVFLGRLNGRSHT